MKKILLSLAIASLAAFGASQAFAGSSSKRAPKTVTVVMHDPGCHWFSVGGKYLKNLTVHGPVALRNLDEATLKVARANGVQTDAVGKSIVLRRGVYKITMVGQAPDDNHLKLVVK